VLYFLLFHIPLNLLWGMSIGFSMEFTFPNTNSIFPGVPRLEWTHFFAGSCKLIWCATLRRGFSWQKVQKFIQLLVQIEYKLGLNRNC